MKNWFVDKTGCGMRPANGEIKNYRSRPVSPLGPPVLTMGPLKEKQNVINKVEKYWGGVFDVILHTVVIFTK